jgi:hypothetical protein
VILVVAGKVEKGSTATSILGPGDCAFIPRHRPPSFNVGDMPRSRCILGPCVGPIGYEVVDVANDVPWKTLRR